MGKLVEVVAGIGCKFVEMEEMKRKLADPESFQQDSKIDKFNVLVLLQGQVKCTPYKGKMSCYSYPPCKFIIYNEFKFNENNNFKCFDIHL